MTKYKNNTESDAMSITLILIITIVILIAIWTKGFSIWPLADKNSVSISINSLSGQDNSSNGSSNISTDSIDSSSVNSSSSSSFSSSSSSDNSNSSSSTSSSSSSSNNNTSTSGNGSNIITADFTNNYEYQDSPSFLMYERLEGLIEINTIENIHVNEAGLQIGYANYGSGSYSVGGFLGMSFLDSFNRAIVYCSTPDIFVGVSAMQVNSDYQIMEKEFDLLDFHFQLTNYIVIATFNYPVTIIKIILLNDNQ